MNAERKPPAAEPRSLAKRLWYGFVWVCCRVFGVALLRVRCHGRALVPRTGGGLVVSNHQSNLDPLLLGLACDRRMNFLARETLFRFPGFRHFISSLDAIPIDREGTGLSGLKETLRRLKRGELVLVFPEGTRTPDGRVQPIKPGFVAVARRSGTPVLPVAMEGAFDAWPRWRMYPRPAVVEIAFGEPLDQETIGKLSDEELVDEVQRRLESLHAFCRQRRALRCRLPGNGAISARNPTQKGE